MAGMKQAVKQRDVSLVLAASAAFGTYFCMYAFRKPFSAGTFEDQEVWGLGLKSALVISQLLGYMLSKFIGIKIVSEMRAKYRAVAILGLIGIAELALLGFALLPTPWKVVMMFINGLPLGMVFGLVLAYLEGRRQTEALSAVLCASFILSSGLVKTIGRWLVQEMGVSEFTMPVLVGAMFAAPLLVSVWLLQRTPPPDADDRQLRSERVSMNREQRTQFLSAYWPGLSLLFLVYVVLTVIRTARDDFGVEIWRDLGVGDQPEVFAQSETIVALCVTAFNALAIWITCNLAAIRITTVMMAASFAGVVLVAWGQAAGAIPPMIFMVACGVGLYIPYVAFHTTVFERLIAASRHPGNLGFLMYVADAIGYLGYSTVLVIRSNAENPELVLPSFRWLLVAGGALSMGCLLLAAIYFQRKLSPGSQPATMETQVPARPELATEEASV